MSINLWADFDDDDEIENVLPDDDEDRYKEDDDLWDEDRDLDEIAGAKAG